MRHYAILTFLFLQYSVYAQDSEDSSIAVARHARMLELAKSYSITVPDKRSEVELRQPPIFSWSTPERQAIGGELYLWVASGRPVATIGIWTYDDVKDSHELQSLSEEPLVASTEAGLTWQPAVGGLQFKKLENASPPASSKVRRQTEMRNILREHFAATMHKDSGQVEKLRLLPQPMYRYELLPEKVIDGAMFAYAFGTDPEVFVLFEAREEDAGPTWYYALAPSTSVRVEVQFDAQVVWTNEDQKANGTFLFRINR